VGAFSSLIAFWGGPTMKKLSIVHWHTRIGTIDEYFGEARAADLRLESVEDISRRAEHFWTTTLALIQTELLEGKVSPGRDRSARGFTPGAHPVAAWPRRCSLRCALRSFSKGR
jgi:hypothetical protein